MGLQDVKDWYGVEATHEAWLHATKLTGLVAQGPLEIKEGCCKTSEELQNKQQHRL